MIEPVDPQTVMDHEYRFVQFLGEEKVESRLAEFNETGTAAKGGERPDPTPDPSRDDPDPIPYMIQTARNAFDQYWRTGQLAWTDSVVNIATIGQAITLLEDAAIVDPDGNELEHGIEDIYPQRMLDEENFWDVFFELEIAAVLAQVGFDVKLVHEGEQGGPDVLVDDSDDQIWIETKRKRDLSPEDEKWTRFRTLLMNRVWKQLDIGPDSFALRISSEDELADAEIDPLATAIARVINDQEDGDRLHVSGKAIDIKLVDYYPGARIIDPESDEGFDLFKDNLEHIDMQTLAEQAQPGILGQVLGTDAFSHLDYEADPARAAGTGNFYLRRTEDDLLKIVNAHVVEYDVPNEVDYARGVMSTINSSISNLSGYAPTASFIHIPFGRWTLLDDHDTTYKGETVTQRKRIEISIKGILGDNPNINAVVLTSRLVDRTGDGISSVRFGDPYFNRYPDTDTPDAFRTFLEDTFTAEFD